MPPKRKISKVNIISGHVKLQREKRIIHNSLKGYIGMHTHVTVHYVIPRHI